MLDVVRSQITGKDEFVNEYLEPMQICQIPTTPVTSLNVPGYIHPLSGNAMNTIIKANLLELASGFHLPFELEEESLVTAYIETDKSTPTALAIAESGGIRKTIALSADQDIGQ